MSRTCLKKVITNEQTKPLHPLCMSFYQCDVQNLRANTPSKLKKAFQFHAWQASENLPNSVPGCAAKRSWCVGVDHGKNSAASFPVDHVHVGWNSWWVYMLQKWFKHQKLPNLQKKYMWKAFQTGTIWQDACNAWKHMKQSSYVLLCTQHINNLQLMAPLMRYDHWAPGNATPKRCMDGTPFGKQIWSQKPVMLASIQPSKLQ